MLIQSSHHYCLTKLPIAHLSRARFFDVSPDKASSWKDQQQRSVTLWRCVYVKSFWEQFQTTLNTGSSNARTVTLNENFVLFGYDSQIKSDSTFDLIILRAKFYIYTCKINKNIPQLHLFKQYLKNTFDVDKYNATLTMSYDKIAAEWLHYKKLIQI